MSSSTGAGASKSARQVLTEFYQSHEQMEETLAWALEDLLDTAEAISKLPGSGYSGKRYADTRVFTIALLREVMEVADELGWKSWARHGTRHREVIDPAKTKAEMADVLAFFGSFLYLLKRDHGIFPADVAAAFTAVFKSNVERMVDAPRNPAEGG